MQLHRLPRSIAAALGCTLALGGCSVDVHVILPGLGTGLGGDETLGDSGEELGDGDGDGIDDTDGTLDFGDGDELAEQSCKVVELDAPLPCELGPTSNVIDPVVAWTWTGPNGEDSVLVTPLVANIDDDNGDGAIDLCDTPDIIVLAVDLPAGKKDPIPPGRLHVLNSVTGESKFVIDHPLDATATPALADLDDDGAPELVAFERGEIVEPGQIGERRVVAFTSTGELAWVSDNWVLSEGGGAIAIADLDADGSPEILAPEHVLSADGELLWEPPSPPLDNSVPTAADLDLDGDLEVLFGGSVYASDGALLFDLQLPGGKNSGMAAIANFDDDPYPEIYVQSSNHRFFTHDGEKQAQCGAGGGHPVAIDDLDGDGRAEILTGHGSWVSVLSFDGDGCETLWSSKINDNDATSSGTAFDLLADGSAEPIYADLDSVRILDDQGGLIAEIPRIARSTGANPIVVDADNDGAAEIIVVGSEPIGGDSEMIMRASVLLVENVDDGFAPTRRIWNQHAYHRSNIREDARVPTEQTPHWLDANSFRTNSAPGYVGHLCQPPAID